MKNITITVVIILSIISTTTYAESLKDEEAIRKFTDSVMQMVAKGDLDSAFDAMKPYVDLSPTEIDAAAIQSKAQREQYGQRFGPAIDFEFIDEKKVGKSLIRLRYIEKTNKHALLWQFYFYRTQSGWTLNIFNWNDKFHSLF